MVRLRLRKSWRAGAVAMLASVLAVTLLSVPSAEAASQTYLFNPLLSLTGGCTVSLEDPVPDPSCPTEATSGSFTSPRSITTDFYGDIYVASYGLDGANGAEGRIDVFGSDGTFITEVPDELGPKSLAVDSAGNLYVFEHRSGGGARIRRFTPSLYQPLSGEIAYGQAPTVVIEELPGFISGLAINVANDHLFVNLATHISEFKSAAEENVMVNDTIGEGILHGQGQGLAVDGNHGRIYASDLSSGSFVVRVFELGGSQSLLETRDGSELPPGKFFDEPSLAVDEDSGDLFSYSEGETQHPVYQETAAGVFVETIEHEMQKIFRPEIAIDNGPASPNKGDLLVPSHPTGVGHAFVFGPSEACAPIIKSVSFENVTQSDAELMATVNPCNAVTSYSFEYTPQAKFESEGFSGALVAESGQLPATKNGFVVSAAATGLAPETAYRFRVVAVNQVDSKEAEAAFTTYPPESQGLCPNDELRTGPSASLPDCRAYELVTPPDTNSRVPLGVDHLGIYFPTREASASGDAVSFRIEGGTIPGYEGAGYLAGDPYLAKRGSDGWETSGAGPTGEEASAPLPGSTSPDQGYSFWESGGKGSALVEGKPATYVRYPDGHSALVGRGSIGTDPRASGLLISENGSHIVFASRNDKSTDHEAVQLEPNAPPSGTTAIYDRTADEVTHVVSLLPGDVTPKANGGANYIGASLDGRGIAFTIGTTLYLRHDNQETFEIGTGVTFAGVAEGGSRIFYLEGGRLWRFDAGSGERTAFSSGAVTPVNVSAEGSTAYFVSTRVLTSEPNPVGAKASNGKENLYRSEEGAISFVGTVTERDVDGEGEGGQGGEPTGGLGLWTVAVGSGEFGNASRFAEDPSRTTSDGNTLLFESRAALAGYDPEGHAEVYRYDFAGKSLTCLSCNPTGAPAANDASLQSISQSEFSPEPFSSFALVLNLSNDGRRAFFQSTEALVLSDTDGLQDVYEWEDQGIGSCDRVGGCIYLISSGRSLRANYLYAVSNSGDNIFFRSSDLLVPADTDETPSIYDARAGGGFAAATGGEPCEGEGCRPGLSPAPTLLPPESAVSAVGSGSHKCPKDRHKVKRKGKTHCVKPHHKHHRQRAGANKGASK